MMLDVLDPKKDAAALEPLVKEAVAQAIQGITGQVSPAIGEAVKNALDGLVITVSFSKK